MAIAKKITIHDVALAAGVSVSTGFLSAERQGANIGRDRRARERGN